MIKKIKKAWRKRRFYRRANQGLFFLSRLDIITKDWDKTKQKQFWRELRSPVSRPRILKELFEALNK